MVQLTDNFSVEVSRVDGMSTNSHNWYTCDNKCVTTIRGWTKKIEWNWILKYVTL